MSQGLVAVGDIGASQTRLALRDLAGQTVAEFYGETHPENYEGSVFGWTDTWQAMAAAAGRPIVAATIAIAARVDAVSGKLLQAGDLSPWLGRVPKNDIMQLMRGPADNINDVVAIAISQQSINAENNRQAEGIANGLGSGWGGALYDTKKKVTGDEPGHRHLKEGATCPCGEEGHAEAWISGNGKRKNTGIRMEDWVKEPGNADQLTTDISTAVIDALNRHEQEDGFWPDELRWTGSVALGQPDIIMRAVPARLRHELGSRAPAFDMVTMGSQAGIHGAFVRARELAKAA